LRVARKRRDQEPLLPQRRPVALRVLDQFVGFGDPERPAPALEPVVKQDACDLTALAGAGAVAQHPATAETHRVLGAVRRGGDGVESRIDNPGSGEKAGMGFPGIDYAFELRVREKPVG
jgi:hypothetical protein